MRCSARTTSESHDVPLAHYPEVRVPLFAGLQSDQKPFQSQGSRAAHHTRFGHTVKVMAHPLASSTLDILRGEGAAQGETSSGHSRRPLAGRCSFSTHPPPSH
jgi:hypothetical protein